MTAQRRVESWRDEFKDAVAPRTVTLVAGALLLQLAFIASYVGAFHAPTPHSIDVGVSGQSAAANQVIDTLNALDGNPVVAAKVSSRSAAVEQIERGNLVAALVVSRSGTVDELLIASGGGSSLVTAVEAEASALSADQEASYKTTDVVPLEDGDARGLSGFYAAIGWLVGGYLMASLLGVAKGARPATARRAAMRLVAAIPYAAIAGLGGALILDPWLGALTSSFWTLAGIGALLTLSAATVTTALQVWFGTFGIGLTILLFVVLGNPSAGGAFQFQMLPSLWRWIGPLLPNGAGTSAIREVIYFEGHGVGPRIAIIVAWALGGAVLAQGGAIWNERRAGHESNVPHQDDHGAAAE